MAMEIERKFLVENDSWRTHVESEAHLVQGYLAAAGGVTVRVRIKDDEASLTVKGASSGISRQEYEYPIPIDDARAMLRDLAAYPPIEKTRYRVRCGAHLWDLDLFAGANAGLALAEIELAAEDEAFALPHWAGAEVSDDPRYYNSSLSRHPYRNW